METQWLGQHVTFKTLLVIANAFLEFILVFREHMKALDTLRNLMVFSNIICSVYLLKKGYLP